MVGCVLLELTSIGCSNRPHFALRSLFRYGKHLKYVTSAKLHYPYFDSLEINLLLNSLFLSTGTSTCAAAFRLFTSSALIKVCAIPDLFLLRLTFRKITRIETGCSLSKKAILMSLIRFAVSNQSKNFLVNYAPSSWELSISLSMALSIFRCQCFCDGPPDESWGICYMD